MNFVLRHHVGQDVSACVRNIWPQYADIDLILILIKMENAIEGGAVHQPKIIYGDKNPPMIVDNCKDSEDQVDYDTEENLKLGNVDGPDGGPPNIEHDIVFGEAKIGVPLSVLNFSYKMYARKHVLDIALHSIPYFENFDLAVGGNVINVPLMYGPITNHYLIQKNFVDETQESQDVNKDVSNIMPDMLEIESQIHKENDDVILENNSVSDDDHVHEDVKMLLL
ncbi:unnamed protein product [Vicia faba]|uniref:Uncharacterized protein n=1 Tax=Vicia faba TaxID=3906 RepID=A0AAV1BA21_VICFA|nr:unnamed protein product [Vicia faba]